MATGVDAVKLVFCLRRASHLSWDEFSNYWREVHAPLLASHAETLGITRYVQVRTINEPELQRAVRRQSDSPEPFDGVAEVWLDSLARLRTASPEARAASAELREDERRFIDLTASPIFVADELVVVDPDR